MKFFFNLLGYIMIAIVVLLLLAFSFRKFCNRLPDGGSYSCDGLPAWEYAGGPLSLFALF